MSEQILQEQGAPTAVAHESSAADANIQKRSHYYRPNADIVEYPDSYRVQLDVAGASAENIDIQFADGVLSVMAPVASRQEPGKRFLLREYGVADYRRSFQVGDQVDVQRITADYAEGVLTLNLPKVAEAQPRKITVNAG